MEQFDRDEIINAIRAVIISTPGGMSDRDLYRDYRSLMSTSIPFKELGFSSLNSFLKSIPNLRVTSSNGVTMVGAIPDEKTKHISSLVARTRSKKARPRPGRGRGGGSRPPPSRASLPKYMPLSSNSNQRVGGGDWCRAAPQPQVESKSAQSRLAGAVINKPSAPLSEITNHNSGVSSRRPSKDLHSGQPSLNMSAVREDLSKDPASSSDVMEEEDNSSSFVDIQWLQEKGRTDRKGRASGARQSFSPPASSASPSPPSPQRSVPLMSLRVQPPLMRMPPQMLMPVRASLPRPVALPPQPTFPNKPRMRLEPRDEVFTSAVDELGCLALRFGYGEPVYKLVGRRPTNEKPLYTGLVKIGSDLKYTSFPDELSSRELAKEFIAKVACEDLKKKMLSSNFSGPIQSLNAPNDSVVVERVKMIVESKENGVFNSAVMDAYRERFSEALPSNWLEIVEKSPEFNVEYFNQKTVIVYPRSTETAECPAVVSPAAKPDESVTTSLPLTNEVSNDVGTCIPKMTFPQDNIWDVYVSCISTNDIWIRLIGDEYDGKYNEAMTELDLKFHPNKKGEIVTNPILNNYYLVDFDGIWSRVQLQEIIPADQSAVVFLIDNGEFDVIPLSDLRCMDPTLSGVPAQAIQCHLAYIDIQAKEVQQYLSENSVIGRSFVASVVRRPSEDIVPTIILFDTEIETQAVNINELLCKCMITAIKPPVFPKGQIVQALISHVDVGCPPYMQIQGGSLDMLDFILEDLQLRDLLEEFTVNAYPTLSQIEFPNGGMFLVRSEKSPGKWRRGIIVGNKNHNQPLVHFVDFGCDEYVMRSDMFDLEKVFAPLTLFPRQAIQVELAQISQDQLNSDVVDRLRELAPPCQTLIAKIVDVSPSGLVPVVEFFKRVQPNNLIVSINTNICFSANEYIPPKKEETNDAEDTRMKIASNGVLRVDMKTGQEKVVEKVNGVSSSHDLSVGIAGSSLSLDGIDLKPYKIPDSPEYFDIYVTLSSNPSNFAVQPLQVYNGAFNDMMQVMQKFYDTNQNLPTPSDKDFYSGASFAAKHIEDFQWYRVIFISKVNSTSVSVHFCDYGDLGLISIDRLKCLDSRFKDVPCLAIRAKLHGVAPKNHDWSVEECLRFNEMVSNRAFVSKIMEKNADSSSSHEWQVALQLVDTSDSTKDVDIASKLIEEGLAKSV